MQKAVTFVRRSWDVGLKNPELYYYVYLFIYLLGANQNEHM